MILMEDERKEKIHELLIKLSDDSQKLYKIFLDMDETVESLSEHAPDDRQKFGESDAFNLDLLVLKNRFEKIGHHILMIQQQSKDFGKNAKRNHQNASLALEASPLDISLGKIDVSLTETIGILDGLSEDIEVCSIESSENARQ